MLNEIEKSEIEKFVANKTMFEAVRKVLLQGIYFEGVLKDGQKAMPLKNFTMELANSSANVQGMISDEALGQNLRAKWEGIRTVEIGFKELEQMIQKVEKKEVKTNQAR